MHVFVDESEPQNQPPSIPPYQGGGLDAWKANPPLTPLIRGGLKAPSPDKGRGGEGFGFESVFLPYNKNLTQRARENRSNPTDSGAFLFTAMNILEPLYEACIAHMHVFVDEIEPQNQPPSIPPYQGGGLDA